MYILFLSCLLHKYALAHPAVRLCSFVFPKQQFERYFEANNVSKQGSFYLQSKIYRAHELLMDFQAEKHKKDVNGGK